MYSQSSPACCVHHILVTELSVQGWHKCELDPALQMALSADGMQPARHMQHWVGRWHMESVQHPRGWILWLQGLHLACELYI